MYKFRSLFDPNCTYQHIWDVYQDLILYQPMLHCHWSLCGWQLTARASRSHFWVWYAQALHTCKEGLVFWATFLSRTRVGPFLDLSSPILVLINLCTNCCRHTCFWCEVLASILNDQRLLLQFLHFSVIIRVRCYPSRMFHN